jgi:hypothetical protein
MSESKRNFPLDLRRRTFSLIRPSLRDHRAGENENPREAGPVASFSKVRPQKRRP